MKQAQLLCCPKRLIIKYGCKENLQMKKKIKKDKLKEMKDFYRSVLLISLGITMILIFQAMLM
mgnify:CR=1 FL=1